MDEAAYLKLVQDVEREFPKFSIATKSTSRLMKIINICLMIITFGQMRRFMTHYFTTIGYTLYVPETWGTMEVIAKAVLLRHERVHMRQRKKYGMLLFSFLYLLFPLPTIFAYYRMKFEWEAYTESMRAYVEYYGLHFVQESKVRSNIISHFTSAEYFWMWPWRSGMEERYDTEVKMLKV